MESESITQRTDLGISCESIFIVSLSLDGLPPERRGGYHSDLEKPFSCQHLPPRNCTEEGLLSVWVNTHQAMFISTGIAAFCILKMNRCIESGAEVEEIREWAELAVNCRLASAVYTDLPPLTRELYEAYLRESMRTVHEGFSGVSNREAIIMEAALRALKLSFKQLQTIDPEKAEKVGPFHKKIVAADKTWWRHHGQAMGKLVVSPVSLARMDFSRRKSTDGTQKSFEDYRNEILREDSALQDYDTYFAVSRRADLTIEDYRQTLKRALDRTAFYVRRSGIMEEYREIGMQALFEVLHRVETQDARA